MPFARTELCYAAHRNLYFQGRPWRRRLRRVPLSSWLVRNAFTPHLGTPSVPETAKLAVWVGFGINEPFCSSFRYRWVFSMFGRDTPDIQSHSQCQPLQCQTWHGKEWVMKPSSFPVPLRSFPRGKMPTNLPWTFRDLPVKTNARSFQCARSAVEWKGLWSHFLRGSVLQGRLSFWILDY